MINKMKKDKHHTFVVSKKSCITLTSDVSRDLCSTVCFLSLLKRGKQNCPRALIATRNMPLARETDNIFDNELPYKQIC